MEHQATLLFTLATAFVVAFVLGFAAARLHIPPLVGYLAAGIAIGPFTPGFHADTAIASQLAEIGVILLMFGVGLHFSVGDAPRNADVTAIDYCQFLTLTKLDFQNFIGQHPELRGRIDSIASQREAMNRSDPEAHVKVATTS